MNVDFENPRPILFQKHSVFLAGTGENTALKVAACAVILGACGVSIYLIVSGFPFPSTKSICGVVLVGGVIGGSVGGVVWYRYKVRQIQKLAREFLDHLVEHPEEKEHVQRLLTHYHVGLDYFRRTQGFFFGAECERSIKSLLKNQETFASNIPKLERLLEALLWPSPNGKYDFLAKQIEELDEGTKKSILKNSSAEVRAFVEKMMEGITCKTKAFVSFYPDLPESVKKTLLISLATSDASHAIRHFSCSLKATPALSRMLEEIRNEYPEKWEVLRKAFVEVFQEEYATVKEVEASSAFLLTLYPFLERSEKRQVFSPSASRSAKRWVGPHPKPNIPKMLDLWVLLVQKTKIAVEDPGAFTEGLLVQGEYGHTFFQFLKEKWEDPAVKKSIRAICQDSNRPHPLSVFVSFNDGGLSSLERAYVQNLSVLQLGDLTALHPDFLQIWLKGKGGTISIPMVCAEYSASESSTEKMKAFFKAFSVEQLFDWLVSPEREAVDFGASRLIASEKIGHELLIYSLKKIRCGHSTVYPSAAQHLLLEKGFKVIGVRVDLLMLWEKVVRIDYKKRKCWMQKLYHWAEAHSVHDRNNLEGLIYFQSGIDEMDYTEGLNIESISEACESQASEESSRITEATVFRAMRELGLDPKVSYPKQKFVEMLRNTHPDRNQEEGATSQFQAMYPNVEVILNFLRAEGKDKTPAIGGSD